MRENLTPFGGRGEGPTGYLYLVGRGGEEMEEIGRQCIFKYFHPAYERTLGFHVRFQPKREVGAENVGI